MQPPVVEKTFLFTNDLVWNLHDILAKAKINLDYE
jgi:hypothetical protein